MVPTVAPLAQKQVIREEPRKQAANNHSVFPYLHVRKHSPAVASMGAGPTTLWCKELRGKYKREGWSAYTTLENGQQHIQEATEGTLICHSDPYYILQYTTERFI